ncbi:FecR family protein [Stenotrophomonas sp. LGBM10]|uniref:FecR family protein n=1 Tax=Stenotrophomonas sp. LGBM10 TaxID=3390038 RepID=UPI00398AA26D
MSDTAPPTPRQLRQALRWTLRQQDEAFDAAAQRRLEAWLQADPRHRVAFERQRAFWRQVDAAGPDVLAALPGLIEPLPQAHQRLHRRRWRSRLLAVAAVLALAVGLGPPLLLELRSDLQSGSQPRTARLPDGSTVVLDADSALAVRFDAAQRTVVLLQGRAWFDVVHAPLPFVVHAGEGEVLDIGTAFAVDMQPGAIVTAVSEGEVEVSAGSGVLGRLRAGQRLAFDARGEPVGEPGAVALEDIAPWRRGDVLLDRTPADQAIARMARYRSAPVWVVGQAGAATPISAVFHVDQPDQAIQAIAGQSGLQVRRLPGGAMVVW